MTDALTFGLSLGRRHPDIRQSEAAECGLACLAMIANDHGRNVSLNTLRQQYPVSLKGMTLKTLMGTAEKLGFACRPLRVELDGLSKLQTPAILHWDLTHYVVLFKATARKVVIHDPAIGVRSLTLDEISRHFTGVAIELTATSSYTPPPPVQRLSVWSLMGSLRGFTGTIMQVILLSIILQLYVLASPFYMQLVVDNGVALNDTDFIWTLAIGFSLFLLINTGASLIRGRILANVQTALSFQMGSSLFRHLLRLPISYFEKRHVGDLVSRFHSIEPIRHLLSEGLIAVGIDGLMALFTAIMIFLYAPRLAFIGLAALALYALLRIVFFHRLRTMSLDLMVAQSAEGSTFIETMRAIQGIKLFNRQVERSALWMNRYADVIQSDARMTLSKQTFRILNDLIFGIENIVIVYLGAHDIISGAMTVGMLFAFMSYKQQFLSKASSLIEKAIEFRMLDVHLDRLADIVGVEPEAEAPRAFGQVAPVLGDIEARNLSFRYAEGEPFIFENLSFKISAGDYVAICGPSGGGKTTLLKILLGLLQPTSGEVLIDGMSLAQIGTEAYRDMIGVVMQDDHLLSGTIADNISFFDEAQDFERIAQCAGMASIHDDIMRMPMGYSSLIGDMGTSLSGGQRQRILLARAFYRRPRLLFMDEGTSSLDIETERRVSTAIKRLGITRIIIAHRPETIATASRRIVLNGRGLQEDISLVDTSEEVTLLLPPGRSHARGC